MKKLETPIVPVAYATPKAAAALDMGEDAFKKYVAPHLRVVRCGRKTLYPVSELLRWVEESTEAPMQEQVRGS